MSKEKILKIIDNVGCTISKDFNDNIEVEEFGKQTSCSGLNEMLEDLLYEVGKELGIESLMKMFKRPLTMTEIEHLINEKNFWNFEDLEEVDSKEDCEIEDKYIYETVIFKHKPSGKHYSFTSQMSNDRETSLSLVMNGEVKKTEVTITKWILKNDQRPKTQDKRI